MGEIHELRTVLPDGSVKFIYFAWMDGHWVDLAPYGNRIPQ